VTDIDVDPSDWAESIFAAILDEVEYYQRSTMDTTIVLDRLQDMRHQLVLAIEEEIKALIT